MGVQIGIKLSEKRTIPRRLGEASSSLADLVSKPKNVNKDKLSFIKNMVIVYLLRVA